MTSKKEYYDGPTAISAEQAKRDRPARNLERENEDLMRKVETMRTMTEEFGKMNQRCQTLEVDLKNSNTNLQHYKERTKALQKQVDGLKSGKLKPDNVPNFKSPNPSQQIIKALLNENEDLSKRIERTEKVKSRVMKNTANVERPDLIEALTQLEEENKGLRSKLNLEDTSPRTFTDEEENVEITQLRERLQMSVNDSRDKSKIMDDLKRELEHNRKLLEEKTAHYQLLESRIYSPKHHPQPIEKSFQEFIPRDIPRDDLRPQHPGSIPFSPNHHPMMHEHYPYPPQVHGYSPSPPPPTVFLPTMAPVTSGKHTKDSRPRTGPHTPHSYQSDMYYKN